MTLPKPTHNELVESLELHLDNPMGFSNQGAFSLSNFSMGIGNRNGFADVVTINASYSNSLFTVYEVKASKQDFRSDVNSGKYLKYLEVCNRLFFAAPKGIISKKDLPEGVGLISYNPEKGWRVTKGAPVKQMEIPNDVLLKFIWANNLKRIRIRNLKEMRILKDNLSLIQRAGEIGKKIGEAVANRDDCYWKKRCENESENYKKFIKEIEEELGLNSNEDEYWSRRTILRVIKNLKNKSHKLTEVQRKTLLEIAGA